MIWLYWLYTRKSVTPVFIRLDESAVGIWIRPGLDLGIFHQVFVHDEYGFHFDTEPCSIIDAGANIGCAAVYFARRFRDAKIICVEPTPSTFELLERNIEPLDNVQAVNMAVWCDNSSIEIADSSVHHLAIRVQPRSDSENTIPVDARTIESIMKIAGIKTLDLLKMDIEGAELEVFERPEEWLDAVQCLVIEFHERIRPGSEATIRNQIRQYWNYSEECRGENVILVRE